MGAGQSFQTNLWNSTLELQSKNNKLGIIRLTDKQTEDSYICRKLSLLDKKQILEIDRLIDIKLSIQSPYVVKLQKATAQKNQQYCAYGKNYYLLFKQPFQTLKQQTLNRKFKNSLYSESQLQMMLQVGVKGFCFLKNIDHPHENISSTAFFINENRSMILGDPFMFSRDSQPPKVKNGFTYPSPQLIKYQNHEIQGYNKHLSDLFTFGLVLLQVFYMSNMDFVYEKYFQRVNHEIISKKLSGIKDVELRKKLFILLDPQPKNREMIFKFYIKSIPAADILNALSKEKFKKTVDRYNLATSEVTQWKNDVNLQNRLASSEGKQTFSVSTNENPSNDQKIYSPQYQQTFQNLVPTQPKQHQTLNQSKLKNTREYLSLRPKSINQPQKKDLYKSNQSSFNVLQKPGLSIKNFSQPYPAFQSSFSTEYQNFSQTNLNRNSYKPLQISNFQTQYPINYQQSPYPNQVYASGVNYWPSRPNYFEYKPQIQLNQKHVQFTTSKDFGTFQYKPLHLQDFSSLKYSPKLLNQNHPKVSQNTNSNNQKDSINKKVIEETPINQNQNFILSQNSKNTQNNGNLKQVPPTQNQKKEQKSEATQDRTIKKDSATPEKQKTKRSSLDYGRYHYLSTINQRSEMTESFISETLEKKSDILIEQDQQNIESLRDCQSQKEKIDDSYIEQNKVWSITYPSGTKYMGEVRNDKRNGLGTFFYIDGSKYHGHWLDNKMNGFGTLYYPNGKIAYQGQWKLDNFHGKGKVFNDQIAKFTQNYHYQDCSDIDNYWLEYEGELFQDRKQGKGTLKLANGEYFQAEFINDELHGLCKFYSRQNKIIEGLWENNKLVKIISQVQKF